MNRTGVNPDATVLQTDTSTVGERMKKPFKRMSKYFKQICKPFKWFVKRFEQIFWGIRMDDEQITNSLPVRTDNR